MDQLRKQIAMEIEWGLHAVQERDCTLSQALERGSILARLRTKHLRTAHHISELNSISSSVSQDAVDLTAQLHSHQTD